MKYFLEQCLCSVLKAISGLQSEVIVIDNASSDGSIEYLLSQFPEVVFIDNPKNVGFARANNQGLKQAKGHYILFLNPDTILSEDCLVNCIAFLQNNLQSGACGVKMLDGSGRFLPESKRGFPSLRASFYKLSGLAGMFPHSKRFARYYLGNLSENEDQQVDVLSGAFFMVKRAVLARTGGFDEQFFMYGEDIDLSYRIQQAGYKNYYLSATKIIHFKGESTKKGSLNHVRLFYKAMSLFVKKHYKKRNTARITLFIQMSIWFRAGISAVKNVIVPDATGDDKGPITTVIIGTNKEAYCAISIIKKQQLHRSLVQYEPSQNWKKDIMLKVPDELIFCEGELSYKEIIESMQDLPSEISLKIYSQGSRSIVGSSSKTRGGQVMI